MRQGCLGLMSPAKPLCHDADQSKQSTNFGVMPVSDSRREGCIRFLQWALPKAGLRWGGYRRVHRTVCKRLDRRLIELDLVGHDAYRLYLEQHPLEWQRFDAFCRIPISRFHK